MEQITEEDFRMYPTEVTTLPVFDGEDGELFGWGHIDKQELLAALPAIAKYYELSDGEYDGFTEDDISYQYATTKRKETDGEFWFLFCDSDTEGAFPITILRP